MKQAQLRVLIVLFSLCLKKAKLATLDGELLAWLKLAYRFYELAEDAAQGVRLTDYQRSEFVRLVATEQGLFE